MNTDFTNSFRDRSVFVTGHTGFKGSWLCLWLNHLGARVTGYALEPPTHPNNFTVSGIGDILHDHYQADIRNEKILHEALRKAAPDVIFHLAAQSIVRKGYQIPRETFDVNVMGSVSLLDGIRNLKQPCVVVIVTSDKCYRNREQIWGYRESDPFGDYDPYGGSKGAAEIAVRTYRHSYFPPERLGQHGVKLASARAGNVIGGGDWTADALIVDVVRALSTRQPVQLRNPESIRPWQHVLQALSGYVTLAARLLESDQAELCSGWNIGPLPGNELPVKDVVELFLKEWGNGGWEDMRQAKQPHEAVTLRLCIDKALWRLPWKPGWDTAQAVRHTARWYKRFLTRPDTMQAFSLEQIAEYEAILKADR